MPIPCNLRISGVSSGGYTQRNPRGKIYLQNLRNAKWWGTSCGSVKFNTGSEFFYYNDKQRPDSRWTARSSYAYAGIRGGYVRNKYTGSWDSQVSKHIYSQKPIKMTIILDNKSPVSRAFIDSFVDDKLKPIKFDSQTNDLTPTLQGRLSSKLDKDARVEIKSTYIDNGKKREKILGYATTNNLNWSFTPSIRLPSGSNLKQDISAQVIDRAGNSTKKDSKSIIVNDQPEARAIITSISGEKIKGKTQLYTNALKPTISGKTTSALKDGERIEIWARHNSRHWSRKFSKSKRLGFAQVDKKNWNFIPQRGLRQQETQTEIST